jgi:hypothetical protein
MGWLSVEVTGAGVEVVLEETGGSMPLLAGCSHAIPLSDADLIAGLEEEGHQHGLVFLVVLLPGGDTVVIENDNVQRFQNEDAERQRQRKLLDEALGRGGIVLGMIALDYDEDNEEALSRTYLFPGYPKDAAQQIMDKLALGLRETTDW